MDALSPSPKLSLWSRGVLGNDRMETLEGRRSDSVLPVDAALGDTGGGALVCLLLPNVASKTVSVRRGSATTEAA